MLIKTWLRQRLLNNPEVAAIVGVKIYPVYIPQQLALPFVTVSRASTERTYISGGKVGSDGNPTVTMHVHCWDRDYDQLEMLEDAVRVAVDGARDNSDPAGSVRRVMIEDELDIPEPLVLGEELPAFGVRFVLSVSHTETAPNN